MIEFFARVGYSVRVIDRYINGLPWRMIMCFVMYNCIKGVKKNDTWRKIITGA